MICIYSKDNTEYSKNGDAVLIPTSCYVSMTINGTWYLTLEHPYDPEERYKYIVEGAVIRVDLKCINELTSVQQRFRVYQYTKNMNSISCIAFPVAMESTYDSPIDNLVITNKTGAEAMALLQAYSEKYTLSTDITAQKSTSFANTNINNAIASGDDNCFISVWGGEILYDNLNYSVKSRLGNNNSGLEIRYGRNLSAIERQTDDSGLTTRIKPISKDGIRLNGAGYVDSPRVHEYPIIHTRYMIAPYNLIEDDVSSNSATAVATRTAQAAVSSVASNTSQSSYSSALGAGYQPEYIKTIKDDIISAVQTMALSNVISTSLYNYLSKTIVNAMSWLASLEQPAWDWMGSYESGWRYGNENGYAVNQYVRIGKKWSYFGSEGYWEEPKDDSDDWDWYQVAGEEGKRYGNFKKYFAHNTYVYITMDGTLTKYWFDSDGWYDSDKTDESDWSWHGSGTAEDPYWFGDPDAEGDSKKYAHSTWLFIDGTYYFFDEFGYYDGSTKFNDYQWDWVESGENFWFGNAEDDTFGAVYVTSQWLKINGTWYYFDSNGYVVSENSSKAAAVAIFTSGMASVKTAVDTQATALYSTLYDLMTAYANKQYSEGVDVPAITITVNMVDLSKTTEYEGYAELETVKLGDSVEVQDDEHDISLSSRVIGLTYDCLRGYNSEVVIGQPASSVSEILGNAGGTPVAGGFDTSTIESQIEALQDKVGDIFMNDASIVTNGVGRFAIQPGSNISISRSGNTLTINAVGGSGDVSLYYGLEPPSNSIGDDKDLYALIKRKSYIPSDNHEGTHSRDYGAQKSWNNKWNFVVTGTKSYAFDSFILSGNINLTNGKRYKVRFSAKMLSQDVTYTNNKAGDGFYKWYAVVIHNYYYNTYQSDYSSDITAYDGDTAEQTGASHEFYIQSLVQDNEWHDYEYEFIARRNGGHCIQIDTSGVNGDIELWIQNLELISVNDYGDEVESLYIKVGNEWLLKSDDKVTDILVDGESVVNEDGIANIEMSGQTYTAGTNVQISEQNVISATDTTYTAGSNVQISAQNVISATDTDEIAELEDVDLTNLADGEILKYNATTQKWENAEDSGGSEVEANPSGTPTDTLIKLGIDGTIYGIEGSGGVEVVDMDYDDYVVLPSADKHDKTKLYAVKNAPDGNVRCSYVEETKTLYFNWGAVYDETTKTLVIR